MCVHCFCKVEFVYPVSLICTYRMGFVFLRQSFNKTHMEIVHLRGQMYDSRRAIVVIEHRYIHIHNKVRAIAHQLCVFAMCHLSVTTSRVPTLW